MPEIKLLSKNTIDQIAAGEVIDRPASVVKELVENAIDAGSTAITVEIKDGGVNLIRITDNGCGISRDQMELAFLRHSTSKIRSVNDLMHIHSLGFRGEALSSIAAISQVEMISKVPDELTGSRFAIEGSERKSLEEIGAPDGTTVIIRNLFFNTPARRKFLKSPQTEGNSINTLMEKLALSHPDISFKFISNHQTKLFTSGNGDKKDIIYQIYGRDIASKLLNVTITATNFTVTGFIGRPSVTRGNRNFEHFFINTRYIKSDLLSRSIEDAFKKYLMQHQYPFCALYFQFAEEELDVNVHPSKMEVRFHNTELIYQELKKEIEGTLADRDHIRTFETDPKDSSEPKHIPLPKSIPEPFEKSRWEEIKKDMKKGITKQIAPDSPYTPQYTPIDTPVHSDVESYYVQETIPYGEPFLSKKAAPAHKIIGQLFMTYWLVEFEDKLYIIDQHAAHEKVLYEQNLEKIKNKEYTSQMLSPPLILTLDPQEEENLSRIGDHLKTLGFEFEPFGGKEYAIYALPDNLYGLNAREILFELLDTSNDFYTNLNSDLILEKIAGISCKAAIKGSQPLSQIEMEHLIQELLELENPYFCPHGRPTIIAMTKYELEKKFKRIV